MASEYRAYQTSPQPNGLAPAPLLGPNGVALEGGLGDAKDQLVIEAKLAVKSRMPLLAPADALGQIGIERGIDRGQSESDAAYATRLQNAWNTWPWAGAPFGVLQALYGLGYANVYLAPVRSAFSTLNGSQTGIVTTPEVGGSWTIDSNAVPALTPWAPSTSFSSGATAMPLARNGYFYFAAAGGVTGSSPPAWPTAIGQTVVDGGVTWTCIGADIWNRFDVIFSPVPASWNPTPPAYSSDEISRIRKVINRWRPAFATANQIIADVSGSLWGWSDGTWGDGGTWGSSTVTYYSPV